MEIQLTLGRIGIGVFGFWLYILLTLWSKKELGNLWKGSYWRGIRDLALGSVLIVITIAILINLVPETGELIKKSIGLAVTTEIASFLSLGYFLGSSGNKIQTKNKLNVKL